MTEDWRERLKHLETPAEGLPKITEGKPEEAGTVRDSRTGIVPPAILNSDTSLSFKASRGNTSEIKRQTKEQLLPSSTASGAFDVDSLSERGQQRPPTSAELLKELEKFSIEKLLAAHRKQKMLTLAAIAGSCSSLLSRS